MNINENAPTRIEVSEESNTSRAFAADAVTIHAKSSKPVNITGYSTVKFNFSKPIGTSRPAAVTVQTRFPENNDLNATDNFAVLVTETSRDFVRFNVWRVDSRKDPSINYSFDLVIVESHYTRKIELNGE